MVELIDPSGKPLRSVQKLPVLKEPQTAKLGWLSGEFAGHPAVGLTPAALVSILQEAEQGDLKAQAELFMDMEDRDAHLLAEIAKRKRAVIGLDWHIQPPDGASAQEQADADFLSSLLQDTDNLEDLLLDLLDGIGHGFSAVEIEWQRAGQVWQPKAFYQRPPNWFCIDPRAPDTLRLRNLIDPAGQALQPLGWLLHRPRAKSGLLARSGLLRTLAWPYLFKHYAVNDLAQMLEIYGLPIRLAKYPPGTGEQEKGDLLRAVTGLGHSAAGIIPESMSIEFEQAAQGTEGPFLAMARLCDEAISKAILGGTLTSSTSDTGGGAYALGQVHNEVRHDLLAADARQLASTVTRDLLWPLLLLNRAGAGERRMPRFAFDLKRRADITRLAQALPSLVQAGLPVSRAWVYEQLGMPEPAEGEAILQPLAAASPLAALTAFPRPLAGAGARRAGEGAAAAAAARQGAPEGQDSAGDSVQNALDSLLDTLPPEAMQQAMEELTASLLAAIENAKDEAEALGFLAEALPMLDESTLVDSLQRLLFTAEAAGRQSAQALES